MSTHLGVASAKPREGRWKLNPRNLRRVYAVVSVFMLLVTCTIVFAQSAGTALVTIGSKTIEVVVADTDASRIQGLLGWNTIDDSTGMLLEFDAAGRYAIHMQGMKFPIDAVWIDSQGVVKRIYENIQPDSGLIYPSIFSVKYCLEINAGFCSKFGVLPDKTIIIERRKK